MGQSFKTKMSVQNEKVCEPTMRNVTMLVQFIYVQSSQINESNGQ